MLVTRECDYAVRILRALSNAPVSTVNEISTAENIPVQYTYKICRKLAKAGILKSHRGAAGGYELCRCTEELTLLDVFNAVESDLSVSECTCPGNLCGRNTCEHPCKVHTELCRLQQKIYEEIQAKKLSELF